MRDFLGEIVADKEQKALRGGTFSELLEASFSNADAEEIASDKFRIKELETKLAAHQADQVFTNDTASLTLEGCERFEAIDTVFATQFGRN